MLSTVSRLVILLAIAACSGRNTAPPPVPQTPVAPVDPPGGRLRAVTEFASIADPATRSRALFLEVSRVLTHPRCVMLSASRRVTTWSSSEADRRD